MSGKDSKQSPAEVKKTTVHAAAAASAESSSAHFVMISDDSAEAWEVRQAKIAAEDALVDQNYVRPPMPDRFRFDFPMTHPLWNRDAVSLDGVLHPLDRRLSRRSTNWLYRKPGEIMVVNTTNRPVLDVALYSGVFEKESEWTVRQRVVKPAPPKGEVKEMYAKLREIMEAMWSSRDTPLFIVQFDYYAEGARNMYYYLSHENPQFLCAKRPLLIVPIEEDRPTDPWYKYTGELISSDVYQNPATTVGTIEHVWVPDPVVPERATLWHVEVHATHDDYEEMYSTSEQSSSLEKATKGEAIREVYELWTRQKEKFTPKELIISERGHHVDLICDGSKCETMTATEARNLVQSKTNTLKTKPKRVVEDSASSAAGGGGGGTTESPTKKSKVMREALGLRPTSAAAAAAAASDPPPASTLKMVSLVSDDEIRQLIRSTDQKELAPIFTSAVSEMEKSKERIRRMHTVLLSLGPGRFSEAEAEVILAAGEVVAAAKLNSKAAAKSTSASASAAVSALSAAIKPGSDMKQELHDACGAVIASSGKEKGEAFITQLTNLVTPKKRPARKASK